MDGDHKFKIRAPKDVDSGQRTQFLKIFVWIFAPIFIIFALLFGPVRGALIAGVIALLGTVIILFFSDRIGNVSKILFGGREANISLREQLQSKLTAVRVAKIEKNFKVALDTVNEILREDPEFYEAMLVKAQILDEGFEKILTAKKYAKEIMENTKKGETINNWATSLYDDLCGKEDSH